MTRRNMSRISRRSRKSKHTHTVRFSVHHSFWFQIQNITFNKIQFFYIIFNRFNHMNCSRFLNKSYCAFQISEIICNQLKASSNHHCKETSENFANEQKPSKSSKTKIDVE